MSEYETPVGPLFDLQREALKRGADILRTGRSVRDDLSTLGLQTSEMLGTGVLEIGRRSLTHPLALAGTATGVDTPRTVVDDSFETLLARHESVYEIITESYEQADTRLAMREAEQLARLLESSERAETHLADAVTELEATPARTDEATTELLDHLERFSDRVLAETRRYGNGVGVRCRVCGERVEALTYAHLAGHGLTVEAYQDKFGDDVPL